MRVHVAFTPAEEAAAPVGIVVDVLRATSSIAQALASGYRRVLCCRELDDARRLRAELPDSVVGGERMAVRVEGFGGGALRRGLPRQPPEPRGGDARGARARGGRRRPLRRLQGNVRLRRRVLRG